MSKEKQIKTCPFCGSICEGSRYINLICKCGAKYYYESDIWLDRKKTKKEVKGDYLISNGVTVTNVGCKSEWISVEERLPERVGTYLVYTYKGAIKFGDFRCYYAKNDKPQFDCDVTHWIPIPEAPKGGEG